MAKKSGNLNADLKTIMKFDRHVSRMLERIMTHSFRRRAL